MRSTYLQRRGELEIYFDKTAAKAWAALTSDAPLSGVRATVRAGRDAMRGALLSLLPRELSGKRVLDAGCGAGQLSMEAAGRGAEVVAVDLSETLVSLAAQRCADQRLAGRIDFRVGDMLDPGLGRFDHIVAMDSVIHYEAGDMVSVLEGFAARTGSSVLFTFAPRTPLLSAMHATGKLFPRSDRSPAIQPVSETGLRRRIAASHALESFEVARTRRIKSGFYISQAMELRAR